MAQYTAGSSASVMFASPGVERMNAFPMTIVLGIFSIRSAESSCNASMNILKANHVTITNFRLYNKQLRLSSILNYFSSCIYSMNHLPTVVS